MALMAHIINTFITIRPEIGRASGAGAGTRRDHETVRGTGYKGRGCVRNSGASMEHISTIQKPETRNQKPVRARRSRRYCSEATFQWRSYAMKVHHTPQKSSEDLGGRRKQRMTRRRADRSGHWAARRAQKRAQGKGIPLEKSTDMQKQSREPTNGIRKQQDGARVFSLYKARKGTEGAIRGVQQGG
ncbi:hypothetical protein DFH06DRAFT_1303085 [Mycena polygramma]|nr:hypothetical protein DFH06DRAFT_1303085 [Mycena polygramma]